MSKNFTIEEQLEVKKALVDKFDLQEKRVSKSWLDVIDAEPDPHDPTHWDYLLYSKEHEIYINLKSFPRITIEPIHTNNYNLGTINYTKKMVPSNIVDYVDNILNK